MKRYRIALIVVMASLILIFGFAYLSPGPYSDKVVVLMYHHLSPGEETSATISPETFTKHMEMLRDEGFNVIPIQALGKFLDGLEGVPPNAVVITFDDGYESVYEYGYPILKEYGYPATVFMIVSRIGRKEGEIPKLTWEQMLEMQESGISFHNHSYDGHYKVAVNQNGKLKPVLAGEIFDFTTNTKESREARQQRVYQDLKLAKEILEKGLEHPVEFFAAPYGVYDEVTIEAARQAGIRYIFNIKSGAIKKTTDPVYLNRVNAGSPNISAEDLKRSIFKAAR